MVFVVWAGQPPAPEGYPTFFSCGHTTDYVFYVAQEWPPSLEDMEAACDPNAVHPDPPDGVWMEGRTIREDRETIP